MDPKAIAKSKRSHTQHGRKSHPPPASVAAQKKKKAAEAGEEERAHRALPSNWDRYGDDNDDGDGVDSKDGVENSNAGGEEAVAKSKGADFSYLIEQAKSNPHEFKERSHRESFEDLSFDFVQGVSSMLSVRGEGLLSWCQDDNFVVDDESISEVPLLSMDLNALAAQLSKLKLSQRLFIEPELVPEELAEISGATQTGSEPELPDSSPLLGFPSSESNINNLKDSHGSICKDGDVIPQGLAVETCRSQTSVLATKPPDESGRREYQKPVSQGRKEVVPHAEDVKISGIEDSEAELDMLLNSFGKIKTSESAPMASQPSKQNPVSFGNICITGLDDSIDDLLSETSIHIQETTQPWPHKEAVSSTGFPHRSFGSESVVSTSLDDSIDDLLAESSKREHTAYPKEDISNVTTAPRSSSLGSKAIDGFDSWFDTV